MFDEFIYDLKVARKKSGLTQADCCHLLGSSKNSVSEIEAGKRMPTLEQICVLSLIFGESFESFYAGLWKQVRANVEDRLSSMPEEPRGWPGAIARRQGLARIAIRLEEEAERHK